MDFNREKLLYLLDMMDYYITELVYNVLDDSVEDPHYSAVSATNQIKCYIDVTSTFKKLPYTTVREYLLFNCLTEEECDAFEESRRKESKYYTQKQY